jgi:hypothetical protein
MLLDDVIEVFLAARGGDEADRYFDELQRFAREVGFNVPTLTANRLHAMADGAIDVWDGWNDLLATGRQLASVSTERPRLVGVRHPLGLALVGAKPPEDVSEAMAGRLARALASGAQFLVLDAFAERHRGATVGRRFGDPSFPIEGFLAPLASVGSVFDDHGGPHEGSGAVRRIASFASGFASLFLTVEPGSQPTVACPDRGRPGAGPFVVPIRGPGGEAVFVFRGRVGGQAGGQAGGKTKGSDEVPLLLRDGVGGSWQLANRSGELVPAGEASRPAATAQFDLADLQPPPRAELPLALEVPLASGEAAQLVAGAAVVAALHGAASPIGLDPGG